MVVQYAMFSDAKDPKEREEQTRKNMLQAREDLDAAIAAGIKDPRAYYARYRLGIFLRPPQQGGDRLEAMRSDLAQAIEMDPLNAGYRFAMGNLLAGSLSIDEGDDDQESLIAEESGPKGEISPEAASFLGLAVELAPENESYRTRHERYVGKK